MAGAGYAPELLRTGGGFMDALGVATRDRAVAPVADEQDGNGARRHGALGRDIVEAETAFLLSIVNGNHGRRTKQRLAEQRAEAQAGVIVGDLAQVAECAFGNDGFDARLDDGRLQRDRPAHGFPESVEMPHFF